MVGPLKLVTYTSLASAEKSLIRPPALSSLSSPSIPVVPLRLTLFLLLHSLPSLSPILSTTPSYRSFPPPHIVISLGYSLTSLCSTYFYLSFSLFNRQINPKGEITRYSLPTTVFSFYSPKVGPFLFL
ncbi:hypothetical protein VNO80_15026 [Phaseolus coccineus]|uniref:Uncharacterized protein n=1 Tax=Phaseolus coccineus TaxID=3886 RepID=A0AAN9MMX5_PHACN